MEGRPRRAVLARVDTLALGTLCAYSGPATALSVLTFALIVYVPAFYTTEGHLSLATAGVLFLLARSWDALIDPLIGLWTDRTVSRWGRRKPWIAIASPMLAIATWLLFQPPADMGGGYLLVCIFIYYFAWTAVQIPYLSWGAELSDDYQERNRIVGFRESITFVGVLLATGLPILIFGDREPSLRDILTVFTWLTFLLLPLSVAWALWRVPAGSSHPTKVISLRQAWAALRSNGPFLRLSMAAFVLWLGIHIYNASVLFVVIYSQRLPASWFLKFVFLQFLVGLMVTGFIVRLANRFGKHRVLACAGLGAGMTLPLMMWVPPGSVVGVGAVFALLGMVVSPIWVLPTALVADAVDYGVFKGGGEQTGMYMAIYNLVVKAAIALSVGVALPLMSVLGFDPHDPSGVRHTTGLNFTGLILPGILWVISFALLWNYPIDRARHAVIRRWLARAEINP